MAAIIISEETKYLGIAMKHPVIVQNGSARLSYGKEAVEESLMTILNTPIGSKFFLPEWGSRLHELIFEPNDEVLTSMMRLFIADAIAEWEKRVKFVDVVFNISEAKVDATIFYKILSSNEIESYVHPFYRELKY